MLVFKSEVGITTYNPENRIIVSTYKGRVKIDDALEHLKVVYEFHLKQKVEGSVVDLCKMHGSFAKLLGFVQDTYMDIVESGLKCSAYVVTDDIIVNNLLNRISAVEGSLPIKAALFKDPAEAIEWVKSNI